MGNVNVEIIFNIFNIFITIPKSISERIILDRITLLLPHLLLLLPILHRSNDIYPTPPRNLPIPRRTLLPNSSRTRSNRPLPFRNQTTTSRYTSTHTSFLEISGITKSIMYHHIRCSSTFTLLGPWIDSKDDGG
jgi:hypothetical protein